MAEQQPPKGSRDTGESYRSRAQAFRAFLRNEAQKPAGERNFPESDEWVGLKAISVCETPGCVSEGLEFEVTLYENADGIYRVLCAPCGSTVDNVTPVFSDGRGVEKLPTRFQDGTSPVSRPAKNRVPTEPGSERRIIAKRGEPLTDPDQETSNNRGSQ